MDNINITDAQYNINHFTNKNCSINCIASGEHVSVPLNPANRHYAEIMRQVEAGTLTILAAEVTP